MIKTSILITEFDELTAFGVLFSGRSVGGGDPNDYKFTNGP